VCLLVICRLLFGLLIGVTQHKVWGRLGFDVMLKPYMGSIADAGSIPAASTCGYNIMVMCHVANVNMTVRFCLSAWGV
jgi:hypothetical protein